MTVPVIFHRLAIQEYREAVDWYSAKSESAASGFRSAVEKAVNRASSQPSALQKLGRVYRWVPIPKFPYLMILRERRNTSGYLVVAIAHQRRRLRYWKNRR